MELKIFIIFGIIFLAVFFSPSSVRAAVIGAPFVPSTLEAVKKGLKMAKLKPGETFYDLGSGTGRVLIMAAKKFSANVVGFEYSRPLFFFSKFNMFLNGIKGKVFRKNFFEDETNLKKADVIFMFLTAKAFPKLRERLENEVRPGTRIVVYLSPLLFWQPDQEITLGDKTKVRLYIKK
jgi:SAM-dependent methyltransferase